MQDFQHILLKTLQKSIKCLLNFLNVFSEPCRLANKQDHFDALDEVDVADKLQLEILANECQTPTRIEICCATQGTGKNIDPIIRIGFQ